MVSIVLSLRVVRLMQHLGISAQVRCSRKPTTHSDPQTCFALNILNRNFEAEQPNRKWVTDTKAVETAEGWLYLAVILDLFSRMSNRDLSPVAFAGTQAE
jgi:putative transposase